MEFGLDMGCALIPTFPPCLDGPAGGRLWITAAHTPQTRVQKNPKNAPECNLIFQKNCLDNWVHLKHVSGCAKMYAKRRFESACSEKGVLSVAGTRSVSRQHSK